VAPDGFAEVFLATAGAGGAFIGLLFVAITIGPERTFGIADRMGPQQLLAEGALVTLTNGFVVSCVALVPGINVGWVTLAGGIWGVLAAAYLGWSFAQFHRHADPRGATWTHLLRVTSISLVAVVVFVIESVSGLRLIRQPGSVSHYQGLALVVITLYALAILRAWVLLGDPQHGLSGWLNPLPDLPPGDDLGAPPAGPS
jgi:hypothetical protein